MPAEPQHRCVSATGSSECPIASRISSTWPADLHAVLQRARRMERDALRPLVHRDHAARSSSIPAVTISIGSRASSAIFFAFAA